MAPNPSNAEPSEFKFKLSLSVLNHLGRNLYRSFITVLGEAVSNSWDADASNVWIDVDKGKHSFIIRDDGDGMTRADFQDKFLKIGYSKRRANGDRSPGGRPFIGRKGIGKLALLSCAESVTVLSKVVGGSWIGGTIENAGLDAAITNDLSPSNYKLRVVSKSLTRTLTKGVKKGTVLYFQGVKGGIAHTPEYLKKIVALYFRFSLVDSGFCIYINGEKVNHKHIKQLAENTEFLWTIGTKHDPYVKQGLSKVKKHRRLAELKGLHGFVASVSEPKHLNITGTGERVSIDLFVNGRLRERDVLRHIPSARVPESYLYGQLHLDSLDGGPIDRFTSSREGVVAGDPQYDAFLVKLKSAIDKIMLDWDRWRLERHEDGDPDNPRLSKKERKAIGLYNEVARSYAPPRNAPNRLHVERWIDALVEDAKYNFSSYADCFISENLIRRLVRHKSVALTKEAKAQVADYRKREVANKEKGNISIDIRRTSTDLSYLDMDGLANMVDKQPDKQNSLAHDAKTYKPMRDAVMHTALLSVAAKKRLSTVYDNISARVKKLLFQGSTGGGRAST